MALRMKIIVWPERPGKTGRRWGIMPRWNAALSPGMGHNGKGYHQGRTVGSHGALGLYSSWTLAKQKAPVGPSKVEEGFNV